MNIVGATHNHYAVGNNQQSTQAKSAPLTPDETALAQSFRELKMFTNKFISGDKSEEALNFINEHRQNPGSFKNVWNVMGIQFIDPTNLFVDIGNLPDFRLPERGFNLCTASNSFNFGVGSSIPLRSGGRVEVSANSAVLHLPHSHFVFPGFLEIIHAATYENGVRWDTACRASGASAQSKLNVLRDVGIDTTRDFSINGVKFTVSGSVVQSSNFSPPPPPKDGNLFLRNLLARAYEQNLFYS